MTNITENTKVLTCLKHLQDDGDIGKVYYTIEHVGYCDAPVLYVEVGDVSKYNNDRFITKEEALFLVITKIIILVVGPGIMFDVKNINSCKDVNVLKEVDLCQKK